MSKKHKTTYEPKKFNEHKHLHALTAMIRTPVRPEDISQRCNYKRATSKASPGYKRNFPCSCGSSKKFKNCCLPKIDAVEFNSNENRSIEALNFKDYVERTDTITPVEAATTMPAPGN